MDCKRVNSPNNFLSAAAPTTSKQKNTPVGPVTSESVLLLFVTIHYPIHFNNFVFHLMNGQVSSDPSLGLILLLIIAKSRLSHLLSEFSRLVVQREVLTLRLLCTSSPLSSFSLGFPSQSERIYTPLIKMVS